MDWGYWTVYWNFNSITDFGNSSNEVNDRKYLKGKWFEENDKIDALGWRWVIYDGFAKIFLGVNKGIPFPVSFGTKIIDWKNINFDINDLNNFQGYGCYFQTYTGGQIIIGRGCFIANNVGLITENHNLYNLDLRSEPKNVVLGEGCWIGMNSVILPGVKLGKNTIVGAGSIVTKSFVERNCVVAGNPAKIIKYLEK